MKTLHPSSTYLRGEYYLSAIKINWNLYLFIDIIWIQISDINISRSSIPSFSKSVWNIQKYLLEGGLMQRPVLDISLLQLTQNWIQLIFCAFYLHFLVVFWTVDPANNVSLTELFLELNSCAICYDLSLWHDQYSIWYAFGFLHVVGCYQDCVFASEGYYELPGEKTHLCVHACCWLIEDQQFGISDHAEGEGKSSSHTSWKGAYFSIQIFLQTDSLQQLFNFSLANL